MKPIYSPRQISAISFLGGPIAAVYFLRHNFLALGNPVAAAHTLWWGIGFNIALIAALPFLPKHAPHIFIPLMYSLVALSIADAKQMKKESIAASTEFCFQSSWKVFGLGIAFLIGTFLFYFLVFLALTYFNIIKLD
jgi:hypothetical protein